MSSREVVCGLRDILWCF